MTDTFSADNFRDGMEALAQAHFALNDGNWEKSTAWAAIASAHFLASQSLVTMGSAPPAPVPSRNVS